MASSSDFNTFSLTALDQKFGNFFQQPSTSVDSNNFEGLREFLPKEISININSPSKRRNSTNFDHAIDDLTNEKQIIKDHPLFPLVEYFFIKCEEAMQILGGGFIHVPDVEAILKKQFEIHGSLSSKDSNVDFLLLKTIQHLRYQHHELQKVDELCQQFRERYLGCLKTKISHESLLGWSDGDSDSCSPPEPSNNASAAPVATIQTATGSISVTLFDNQARDQREFKPVAELLNPILPNSSMSASLPMLISTSNNVSDSTRLSLTSPASNAVATTIATKQYNIVANIANLSSISFDMDSGDNGETGNASSNSKPKRGSLPRRSVELLRTWLFQHILHPYPSEDEKRQLSKETGLNLIQVNNWFINARRRILQPLLDGNERSSSPNSPEVVLPNIGTSFSPNLKRNIKSSKSKMSSSSYVATKHWPEAGVVSNQVAQENDERIQNSSVVERSSKKRRKKRKLLEAVDYSDHETSDDDSIVDGFLDEKHNKSI